MNNVTLGDTMNTTNCPNCGREIDIDSAFCTFCGRPVVIGEPGKKQSASTEKRTSSTRSIIIPILVLIIALLTISNIVFLVLWLNSSRSMSLIPEKLDTVEDNINANYDVATQTYIASDENRFYTVNKATGIYHYPECEDAGLILAENKRTSITNRAELTKEGYSPCKKCIGDIVENTPAKSEKTYDYKSIELKTISNDKFKKVGYDKTQMVLLIQFKASGDIYAYHEIPLNTYTNFIQANNLEDYWNKNIRRKYHSEKIN